MSKEAISTERALKLALEALELAKRSHGMMLLSNPPQEAWKTYRVDDALSKSITALREALANEAIEQPAQQGCLRCNTPKKCALYGCSPLTWPAEQPAQQEPVRVPVTDSTYNYAKSLAEAIFKQHFASDEHYSSGRIVWGVNDTVIGILTQIDNMVADMVRKPAQQEPVAWRVWRGDAYELFFSKYAADRRADCFTKRPDVEPLYTSPPAQRKPLTDEEIAVIAAASGGLASDFVVSVARAIEAAHGIKENT